jgi:hypothetical protein
LKPSQENRSDASLFLDAANLANVLLHRTMAHLYRLENNSGQGLKSRRRRQDDQWQDFDDT